MRHALLWAVALAAGGCASRPGREAALVIVAGGSAADRPDGQGTAAGPTDEAVERALRDLSSADPARRVRAHQVLRAAGDGADARLRRIVHTGSSGSPLRLEALSVLSERGDPLDDIAAPERVQLSLLEMARGEPGEYGVLRGLARLDALGAAALDPLAVAARRGGVEGRIAARYLEQRAGEVR